MYDAILFDFETLDNTATSRVLDLAAVVFNEEDCDDFGALVSNNDRTFYAKFDVADQPGRTFGKSTLEWWQRQSDEVQAVVKPSVADVKLVDGIKAFKAFCDRHGINKDSRAYVRGASFDFAIMADIVKTVTGYEGFGDDHSMFPVAFWNQYDVRTAVSWAMLSPGKVRRVPISRDKLKGFVLHNSVHDCCKDVVLLQTVLRYAKDEEVIPDSDYILV